MDLLRSEAAVCGLQSSLKVHAVNKANQANHTDQLTRYHTTTYDIVRQHAAPLDTTRALHSQYDMMTLTRVSSADPFDSHSVHSFTFPFRVQLSPLGRLKFVATSKNLCQESKCWRRETNIWELEVDDKQAQEIYAWSCTGVWARGGEDFRVDCEEFRSRSNIGAVQIRSPCPKSFAQKQKTWNMFSSMLRFYFFQRQNEMFHNSRTVGEDHG